MRIRCGDLAAHQIAEFTGGWGKLLGFFLFVLIGMCRIKRGRRGRGGREGPFCVCFCFVLLLLETEAPTYLDIGDGEVGEMAGHTAGVVVAVARRHCIAPVAQTDAGIRRG